MNAVTPILLRESTIEWDRYLLSDEDVSRFVSPNTLVQKISDIAHGRGALEGCSLPWGGLNDLVRLKPGKLSLWAGINFHGKTAMLKQMALHLARSGHKVCIASLEESVEETMHDLVQQALPHTDIRESDEWIDIVCNWAHGKLWLYNQTRMIDPNRALALIAYAAQEKGCTHFILDSLMRTGLPQDDYEGQRVFINRLSNYARQLGIHIHLVHHIVKVDESNVPGRESIRGGGAIQDQFDHIFIVWRDVNEEKDCDAPDGMLVIAKNRGIRPANYIGKVKMWVHKSGQFMRAKTHAPMEFISLNRSPITSGFGMDSRN
jgi:twinkle protein